MRDGGEDDSQTRAQSSSQLRSIPLIRGETEEGGPQTEKRRMELLNNWG